MKGGFNEIGILAFWSETRLSENFSRSSLCSTRQYPGGEAACIDLISQGTGDVYFLQEKMQVSWVLRVSGCQLVYQKYSH